MTPRAIQLKKKLFRHGTQTFAVVDAARSNEILSWVRQGPLTWQSLYSGVAAITLEEQAPYLVQLSRDAEHTTRMLEYGWGKAYGIFVNSRMPFAELRLALKKKLVVRDEQGGQLYFRFYDPRVLRRFLAAAPQKSIDWFFDPAFDACFFENNEGHLGCCERFNAEHGSWLKRLAGTSAVTFDIVALPSPNTTE